MTGGVNQALELLSWSVSYNAKTRHDELKNSGFQGTSWVIGGLGGLDTQRPTVIKQGSCDMFNGMISSCLSNNTFVISLSVS